MGLFDRGAHDQTVTSLLVQKMEHLFRIMQGCHIEMRMLHTVVYCYIPR